MSTIVIDTNAASLVSANRRIHWSQRAKLQKHWRLAAFVAARAEQAPAWTLSERRAITATIRYPDKRRRDVSNLYPLVVKPAIDGLVDAAWLFDDSDDYVESVTIRRDPENGPHRVTITVERAP